MKAVGGMHSLTTQVHAFDAAHGNRDTLAFIPASGTGFFLSFLVLLSLNWWASWYPGAEPGGGGYIAQRIFSAKDEKNSIGATLWFNIAHYALRPWPWIATALVALVLLPSPTDAQGGMEGAYVWVMVHYLPPSLRGLMLAGFAAAYMSTIGTHLNLGASYLVNDLYGRFIKPNQTEHHYVAASRIATIFVALLSAGATFYMQTHGASIANAWKFLLALGAGAGLVFILRWYWWRINAWSELSAMLAAATISLSLESGLGMPVVRAPARHRPATHPRAAQHRRPTRLRLAHAPHHRAHHAHLADGHVSRHGPRTFGRPAELLRPRPAGSSRLAALRPVQHKDRTHSRVQHLPLAARLRHGLPHALRLRQNPLRQPRPRPHDALDGHRGLLVLFWSLNRQGWSAFR